MAASILVPIVYIISDQIGQVLAHVAVDLQLVIEQAKAKPLAHHGEIGNGRADESRPSDRTSTRGETHLVMTRRIARDQPELLDQNTK